MSITDRQFNILSQYNHALTGAIVIFGKIALFGTSHIRIVAGVFVVYAALKEFVYDRLMESEEVSGGWWGDVVDFSFYFLGAGMAVASYYLWHQV